MRNEIIQENQMRLLSIFPTKVQVEENRRSITWI